MRAFLTAGTPALTLLAAVAQPGLAAISTVGADEIARIWLSRGSGAYASAMAFTELKNTRVRLVGKIKSIYPNTVRKDIEVIAFSTRGTTAIVHCESRSLNSDVAYMRSQFMGQGRIVAVEGSVENLPGLPEFGTDVSRRSRWLASNQLDMELSNGDVMPAGDDQ